MSKLFRTVTNKLLWEYVRHVIKVSPGRMDNTTGPGMVKSAGAKRAVWEYELGCNHKFWCELGEDTNNPRVCVACLFEGSRKEQREWKYDMFEMARKWDMAIVRRWNS